MYMFRLFILFLFLSFLSLPQGLRAQDLDQDARNMGLFISSKNFSFSEDFYKEISQFLTLGEDRSWAGKMKPEFIIRTGWLLQEQLQKIENVDSLYFLNAEPKLGRALLDSYNFESRRFNASDPSLKSLEKIFIINSFSIIKRKHRSVFIRSNKMYTEYIPIMVLSFNISVIDPKNPSEARQTEVCFDAQKSSTDAKYFDLYAKQSQVGKLLSNSFSQWWSQLLNGIPSNCVE